MKMTNLCAMALCALAVTACADKPVDTSGSMAGPESASRPPPMAAAQSATPMQATYGVVQAIDQLQRKDVGVGVMGAAAAGGMPTDKVYRVTLRMDDGSTQMVALESMPNVKIGGRIRYNNGMVTPY